MLYAAAPYERYLLVPVNSAPGFIWFDVVGAYREARVWIDTIMVCLN